MTSKAKMPRILHIINKLDLGGAEIMLLDILKYANHDKFDYHILLPMGEGVLDDLAKSQSLKLHYLENPQKKTKLQLFNDGVKFIRDLKPDLIHTHTRLSDMIGLYGGKKAGVPVRLMTVHAAGMYFLDSDSKIEGLAEMYIVRYATHFAVISNGVKKYLQKNVRIPDTKITLIYNGIDPERVCPENIESRQNIRAQFGFKEQDFVIMFAGRLIHEKGVDILINEFNRFHKETGIGKLFIVGKGDESETLSKLVQVKQLEKQVVFHSEFGSLAALFQAADCFVMPSRQEGFGLVILEAMANGIPVIASNVGGIPEIIKHNANGILCDINRQGDIADALKTIHSDTDLVNALIQNGKTTAFENFHVKFTASNYEKLYRNLMSGN